MSKRKRCSKLFIEKDLIQLIKDKPELWFDMSHKDWHCLAKVLDLTVKSIKNKWRTLLDHYKKESLIHDKEFKSEWPHFKDMSFLDSKLKQKRCLLTSEANVNNKVLFKFCDIPNNNDDTCESISDLDPSIAKRLDSFNEQLQVIECEKTNIINQSKTDEDIIFLNSLVPNMKKFDQRQKLILRNKIQQFVHDFVFFDE